MFSVPHLYDFHSSLPIALDNFGYHRHKTLIRAFELLERFAIRNTDAIITISPALTEYVRELDNKIPIVTIEDITETGDLTSVKEEEAANVGDLYSIDKKRRVILYAGTFEHYQGLDLLLSCAELIIKKNKIPKKG